MSDNTVNERLKEIFETTVESDIRFDGSIDNIDYYNLFCKAAEKDSVYKMLGNNLCTFNCTYNDKDSVMLVFFIPINAEETGAKNIAERVMNVVEKVETCFVTIDYLKSHEVKEDKFLYVVVIKSI